MSHIYQCKQCHHPGTVLVSNFVPGLELMASHPPTNPPVLTGHLLPLGELPECQLCTSGVWLPLGPASGQDADGRSPGSELPEAE
jgi:hypothetical protein